MDNWNQLIKYCEEYRNQLDEIRNIINVTVNDCIDNGFNLNGLEPFFDEIAHKIYNIVVNTIFNSGSDSCVVAPRNFYLEMSKSTHCLGAFTYGLNRMRLSVNILVKNCGDDAVNTLAHECLHGCLRRGVHHGAPFQEGARILNKCLGLNIHTCAEHGKIYKKIKYIAFCPCCGTEWKYTRRCKTVTHPENYKCAKCNCELKAKTLAVPKVELITW